MVAVWCFLNVGLNFFLSFPFAPFFIWFKNNYSDLYQYLSGRKTSVTQLSVEEIANMRLLLVTALV